MYNLRNITKMKDILIEQLIYDAEADLKAEELDRIILEPVDKMTKDEKRVLLLNYLEDEVYVNAMTDLFSDEELTDYIKQNSEVILNAVNR